LKLKKRAQKVPLMRHGPWWFSLTSYVQVVNRGGRKMKGGGQMTELNAQDFTVPFYQFGSEYGAEELEVIRDLFESKVNLSCGPKRAEFEELFAAHLGVDFALALPSCTTALEMATRLIGLQPGDEVIATPQTYQATIKTLLNYPEVSVRFCDIDPITLNADPLSIEALVSDKTAAIFVVDYGGYPADVGRIAELAHKHGAVVVEDCAHALGARKSGKPVGSEADIACFSFQSSKNISTLGEGGMLTCDREEWASAVDQMRSCEPLATFVNRNDKSIGKYTTPWSDSFQHEKNAFEEDCTRIFDGGTNGVLSEPASAVGIVQMARLNSLRTKRTKRAERLDAELSQIPGVSVQTVEHPMNHAHHLYTFFVDPNAGLNREAFIQGLRDHGIEMQLRYFPLHLLPEWRYRSPDGRPGACPVTEEVWFNRQLNLPCMPALSDLQVEHMIESVWRVARSQLEYS
jgi:perosamine synthetase